MQSQNGNWFKKEPMNHKLEQYYNFLENCTLALNFEHRQNQAFKKFENLQLLT
jgi:hypothetical protein